MRINRSILYLLLCAVGCSVLHAQGKLQLDEPTDTGYLKIDLQIPNSIAGQIHEPLRSGSGIPVNAMKISGEPVEVEEMKTRGKSSAFFYRKSFNVQLKDAYSFKGPGGKKKMKHFYLLAQAMDTHYFRNHFAFSMMRELGVADFYFQYAELSINGHSEGIYLVIERPYDVALRDQDAPVVYRRLESRRIDKEKSGKKVPKSLLKKSKKAFLSIPDFCHNLTGDALYDSLSSHLDLDDYFSWLAFNYWAMNGDYTDEVCYYIQPDHRPLRFGIVPWDFDDLLTQAPHEGMDLRNRRLGDALIYSSEDLLDRTIAADSVVYGHYLEHFRAIFPKMTDPRYLQMLFNQIYLELAPFYANPDNYTISSHDREATDPESMKRNFGKVYAFLLKRSEEIKAELGLD